MLIVYFMKGFIAGLKDYEEYMAFCKRMSEETEKYGVPCEITDTSRIAHACMRGMQFVRRNKKSRNL